MLHVACRTYGVVRDFISGNGRKQVSSWELFILLF